MKIHLLLLISGGHSQYLVVKGGNEYEQLGTTIDDALGEAFDKTSKILNLGYPGGPNIEKYAKLGDIKKFKLPVGLSDHTIGNTAAISAVSLGACMIEKHFNLDDKKKTIDSFFSSSETYSEEKFSLLFAFLRIVFKSGWFWLILISSLVSGKSNSSTT